MTDIDAEFEKMRTALKNSQSNYENDDYDAAVSSLKPLLESGCELCEELHGRMEEAIRTVEVDEEAEWFLEGEYEHWISVFAEE